MSYQGSPFSAVYGQDDFELDDDNEDFIDDERDGEDPDETDEGLFLYFLYNFLHFFIHFIYNSFIFSSPTYTIF